MHLLLFYPDRSNVETPREYAEFLLCRMMGWTFDELEQQPAYRVAQAYAFMAEEEKARKFHAKER